MAGSGFRPSHTPLAALPDALLPDGLWWPVGGLSVLFEGLRQMAWGASIAIREDGEAGERRNRILRQL